MENKDVGRRDFLKKSVLAGASLGSMGKLAGAQDDEGQPAEVETEKKVPRRQLGATGCARTIVILVVHAFD